MTTMENKLDYHTMAHVMDYLTPCDINDGVKLTCKRLSILCSEYWTHNDVRDFYTTEIRNVIKYADKYKDTVIYYNDPDCMRTHVHELIISMIKSNELKKPIYLVIGKGDVNLVDMVAEESSILFNMCEVATCVEGCDSDCQCDCVSGWRDKEKYDKDKDEDVFIAGSGCQAIRSDEVGTIITLNSKRALCNYKPSFAVNVHFTSKMCALKMYKNIVVLPNLFLRSKATTMTCINNESYMSYNGIRCKKRYTSSHKLEHMLLKRTSKKCNEHDEALLQRCINMLSSMCTRDIEKLNNDDLDLIVGNPINKWQRWSPSLPAHIIYRIISMRGDYAKQMTKKR